jgi:cardiolipin synthase A/B
VSIESVSWTAVATAAYAAGIFTAAHALLYKKRNPSGALAWIALCLLLPVAGSLLYLMVGHDRVSRRRRRRIRAARSAFFADAHTSKQGTTAVPLTCPVPTLQRVSDAEVRAGNAVEAVTDAAAAIDRMLAAVASAKRTVRLQIFIFDADDVGRRVVAALAERARAGVDVRVLYDAVGTSAAGARLIAELRGAGAHFDAFLPFHPLKRRFQINLRNHRKILLIDDERVFTGSMNVSARHLSTGADGSRDLVLEIRGPVVRDFSDVFSADWRFATEEQLPRPERASPDAGDETLQLVESGPDHVDRGILHVLLAALYAAQRDVLILTPYFIPPPELLTALQTAAARGVRLRLVIPGIFGSNPFMRWATRSYLPPLEREGVEISESPGPLMHMKVMIIDDSLAIVGSTNLDYRSFYLNFEADLVVYGGGALQARLREVAEAEWAASQKLKGPRFEKLPLYQRLGIRFVALFSPIL